MRTGTDALQNTPFLTHLLLEYPCKLIPSPQVPGPKVLTKRPLGEVSTWTIVLVWLRSSRLLQRQI